MLTTQADVRKLFWEPKKQLRHMYGSMLSRYPCDIMIREYKKYVRRLVEIRAIPHRLGVKCTTPYSLRPKPRPATIDGRTCPRRVKSRFPITTQAVVRHTFRYTYPDADYILVRRSSGLNYPYATLDLFAAFVCALRHEGKISLKLAAKAHLKINL